MADASPLIISRGLNSKGISAGAIRNQKTAVLHVGADVLQFVVKNALGQSHIKSFLYSVLVKT